MGKFSRLGNDLYSGKKSIDFVGRKWLWYSISAVIVLVSVLGLTVKGLDMGIEFVGGAEYKVTGVQDLGQDVVDDVRTEVGESGIEAAEQPVVNSSGDDGLLVQVKPVSADESEQIKQIITEVTGASEDQIEAQEIGPSWGRAIAEQAARGLVVFLILVVLFIWAYFREWKMSVGAIVALAHDVVITIGVYAFSGFEVTPATVTGLLTILGFSLYDTVVVFDKVRENTKDLRQSRTTYAKAANLAVNQTLVRSINTSIVALIPVGAILYVGAVQLGASTLKDLALALFVGMAAGAYSSIFIATPLLVQLKAGETDILQAEKREKARQKKIEADRYAAVPTFREDMPIAAEPGGAGELDEDDHEDDEVEPTSRPVAPAQESRAPGTAGRGRVAPPAHGPVRPSGAAGGRQQPTRQPRSKRGKK